MKKRPSCPACGRAFRKGARVFVLVAGALERRIVCPECAQRGITIVVPDTSKGTRDALAPYAAHLYRIAKAYEGTERGEGLRQAADILAEGRAVQAGDRPRRELPVEVEPRVEVSTEAMLAIRAEEARGRPHERIDCWCGRKHPELATNGKHPSPSTTRSYNLTKCERTILTALVQKQGGPATRAELAILSGYSSESGGFGSALANLRASGAIVGRSSAISATAAGVTRAGVVEPLPRGSALLEYWCGRVGVCGSAILQTLATAYPGELSRDELAERTGYSAQSGGFGSALARLRTLTLVEGLAISRPLAQAVGLPSAEG